MSHRNARLTVHGRRILVERVLSGRPIAHVAAEMGISRPTAHKWVRRWRTEGDAGLAGGENECEGRQLPSAAR
ncbi:leucine zipper domain-containing protein [Streptomyces sp. NPDC006283]|uniref:helix-turn-helix domain-containing protein n=1 Tax=Streptomyces sp. NPDC006283 TaxID=3156741 RepID=UPI0033AD3FB1